MFHSARCNNFSFCFRAAIRVEKKGPVGRIWIRTGGFIFHQRIPGTFANSLLKSQRALLPSWPLDKHCTRLDFKIPDSRLRNHDPADAQRKFPDTGAFNKPGQKRRVHFSRHLNSNKFISRKNVASRKNWRRNQISRTLCAPALYWLKFKFISSGYIFYTISSELVRKRQTRVCTKFAKMFFLFFSLVQIFFAFIWCSRNRGELAHAYECKQYSSHYDVYYEHRFSIPLVEDRTVDFSVFNCCWIEMVKWQNEFWYAGEAFLDILS